MNYFRYKGYLGTIEYSPEDKCMYGKIAFIRDLVTYEADTPENLEREFRISVDDYLLSCEERGRKPNKPFQGTINIRTGSELHRKLALAAEKEEKSLNAYICESLRKVIGEPV